MYTKSILTVNILGFSDSNKEMTASEEIMVNLRLIVFDETVDEDYQNCQVNIERKFHFFAKNCKFSHNLKIK